MIRDWGPTDQHWDQEWHVQAAHGLLQVKRGEELLIISNAINTNDYVYFLRTSDGQRGYVHTSCVRKSTA